MMAHYSLLTSDQTILADKKRIQELLCQGIKVIAFGASSNLDRLAIGLEKYKNARLLQLYPIPNAIPVLTIKDGSLDAAARTSLESISRMAPAFNHEQYLIEHADANNSLFVEAGAVRPSISSPAKSVTAERTVSVTGFSTAGLLSLK